MATNETWPEYLRRITRNATGAEISRDTGISASTVSRWLSGETKPTTDKLKTLASNYPFQISEALEVLEAYQPPRGPQYIADVNGVRVILRADATRQQIIECYSDLELASELVRRIDEKASVEEPGPLPIAQVNVGGPYDHQDLPEIDDVREVNLRKAAYRLATKRKPASPEH